MRRNRQHRLQQIYEGDPKQPSAERHQFKEDEEQCRSSDGEQLEEDEEQHRITCTWKLKQYDQEEENAERQRYRVQQPPEVSCCAVNVERADEK